MKRMLGLLVIIVGALLRPASMPTGNELLARGGTVGGGSGRPGAGNPAQLPRQGWKEALNRTKEALKDKNLTGSAAGVAYYATLSFFPTLLGIASLYAVFASPRGLVAVVDRLDGYMPSAIHDLVVTQVGPLADAGRKSFGLAALISVAALLWSLSGGLQNLVKALNEAYEVRETRGLVKLRAINIGLSIFLLVFGGLIMGTLLVNGGLLQAWGVPAIFADSFAVVRWPLLVLLISVVLSVVYRYAPDRTEPHWSWVSWGAAAATAIWLAATVLFFIYVQNFGNFNRTYGTFTGIIVLMMWFNVSSLIVLIGAQVNQKLESVASTRS